MARIATGSVQSPNSPDRTALAADTTADAIELQRTAICKFPGHYTADPHTNALCIASRTDFNHAIVTIIQGRQKSLWESFVSPVALQLQTEGVVLTLTMRRIRPSPQQEITR